MSVHFLIHHFINQTNSVTKDLQSIEINIIMSTRTLLKPIVRFITVLGLDSDRVPSVSELKTSYRERLHLHPDKAGVESTSQFQELTQAAHAVLEFLTANSNLQPEVNDDDDILGSLVQNNNLKYNKGSTSFDLPLDSVQAWLHEFGAELGLSKPLANSVNDIQFIKDSWSLDGDQPGVVTTFGKVMHSRNFLHVFYDLCYTKDSREDEEYQRGIQPT